MFGDENLLLRTNIDNIKSSPFLNNVPAFYMQCITGYTGSKMVSDKDFKENFEEQILWGNPFVTYMQGSKKHTMFFKEWIEVGLLKIKNLRFNNSKLDERFIFDRVRNKSNIFCQILLLKKSLSPYKDIIEQVSFSEENHVNLYVPDAEMTHTYKSKFFYKNLVTKKHLRPVIENTWCTEFHNPDLDFSLIYEKNITCIKDIKLAEFNFKLLNGIMPCNLNLKRWGKRQSDACAICGMTESSLHLLYDCEYVTDIWHNVEQMLLTHVSRQDIIIGDVFDNDKNHIITLIKYMIYKEWLVLSLNGKDRQGKGSLMKFKNDLLFKSKVYNNLHFTFSACIDRLIGNL
jgi:hypothetical protein